MRGVRILALAAVASLVSACSAVTGGPLVRPGEPVGAIDIVNQSRHTLTAVLISDCSATSYGLNRLPSGVTIPPGRSYRFTVSAGCWDVDAGLAQGTTLHEARFRTQVRAGRVTRHNIRGG